MEWKRGGQWTERGGLGSGLPRDREACLGSVYSMSAVTSIDRGQTRRENACTTFRGSMDRGFVNRGNGNHDAYDDV